MQNARKRPCKFKQNCNNFKQGKDCPYSHDPCRFGDRCKDIANCQFYHGGSSSISSVSRPVSNNREFSQPKSQVQCRFGALHCRKFAQGKCQFKHSPQQYQIGQSSFVPVARPAQKKFDLPKHQTPCQFGARCNMFPLGKCPFKHQQSSMPPFQSSNSMAEKQPEDTSQSFKTILSGLCFNFLMNRTQHEDCGRPHEFTLTKTIKKTFQVDNQKITKCSIFQCYQQDEQPIYVILAQGRIVFGQLVNLAKECGMEHINNSAMVFKRCFNKDIAFQEDPIQDFYLTYTLNENYPRTDILVMKTSRNLHICQVYSGAILSIPNNRNILSAIFINQHLLISFQDKTKLFLRYNFFNFSFQEDNCPITTHLYNLRGYFKKLYGSEVAGSIMDEKNACFINERFETHMVQMEEKIKDILILENEGTPIAFILTQKQLFALNLLTFQKKSLLQGGIGQGLQFTSLAYTLNHIFIAIDSWGILIYNMNTLQAPTGVLCLGDRQWRLSADDRGNLCVISREKDGYTSWWVYKVRRH